MNVAVNSDKSVTFITALGQPYFLWLTSHIPSAILTVRLVKLRYFNDFIGCEIMRTCTALHCKQYQRTAPLSYLSTYIHMYYVCLYKIVDI